MAMQNDPSSLGDMLLFRDLTPAQLTTLHKFLHRRVFPAKTNLITVEQPGGTVYIILHGTVKIHVEQVDGTDVIIAFGGPGDVEGEMSLLGDVDRSANVVTQEETTVLWINRVDFQECLRTMPALTYNLLRITSDRLRLANERIQALCSLNIDGRVARQILAFARQYGKTLPNGDVLISIRLTQSDIASLVGATRERVNQIMNAYKRNHYLSVDRQSYITIHNQEALTHRHQ